MGSWEGAVGRATEFFDSNRFRDRLAELMAISGTSQDPVSTPPGCAYRPEA